MIYVPIKHLKPKMVLAKDVCYGSNLFSLVVTGQELTTPVIQKLCAYNIQGAYIESRVCGDVKAEEFIDPDFKESTLKSLKKIYGGYTNNRAISSIALRSTIDTAEKLIMYLLSKDEFLVNIIDIKDYDNYTYTHSMYVGILSTLIGIQKGYSHNTLLQLAMCGLMHDIGKLDVPAEIINKKGSLSNEEYELVKTHPENAVKRMQPNQNIPQPVLAGILCHHEKFDGTGYPYGLAGKKIPEFARILAVSDVYDALTSERSYRSAWAPSEAIEYMMGCRETHFDGDILQIFLHTVAAYPVGTMVKLSNNAVAIVSKNTTQNSLRPDICIILPEEDAGKKICLSSDETYLNVTITGTIDETTSLPSSLFV